MKDFLKKVLILFTVLLMSMPSSVLNLGTSVVRADDPLNIETRRIDEHTTITQNGCYRKIEKTDATDWTVPRKPIDLVILQDASGSFRTTIPSVKNALKRLTTYVSPEQYDETNPHLVKTDDPRTTDRVFVASYQGLDQVRYFNNNDFSGNPADTFTDPNTTGKHYTYGNSGLTSDQNKVHKFIDNIAVDGGTPTVPAIQDTIAQYNRVKGNMENGRKTVFLLVTDGVANGYRLPGSNTVVMDKSYTRTWDIQRAWGVDSYPEAAQDITGRANELRDAGNQLKAAVGSEGSVVVGFWERVDNFTEKYYQYGPAYLNGFGNTINIGDNRSVQAIFHDALQSMASPDKVVNGKNVSFYVNEQNNIDVFSQKILESVAAALVKDDITGEFDITDGYKVDAIRINGKKIVPKVTDPNKEIRGTITQTGNKVKISVPDSVFNPGKNSFDYDLSKEARAPETDEDSEVDPPENYVPEKEEITVPELTGKFKAGDFETRQIGGRNQTVEVQKLEYCYPSATKTVKDADASNDIGVIPDPLELTKKPSYSAQLSKKDEEFTYTVDYNFNNVPYEFEKNVMLTDPIDYRLEVVSHSAQGPDGQSWPTRVVTQQDAGGNSQSVVVADVPPQGKDYNYLIMKKAKLKMTVRLKEEYRKNQASKAYLAILQNNNGYGLVNQGNIMWNGEDDSPNQDAHAKTKDKASTIRRSNPIYVKPPLDTEVDKKVNEKEHEGLQADGEEFEYKVTAPWPGIADKFTLTDTVVDELEIVPNSAKVTVAGKSYNALTKAISINGQTIEITLDKTQLTSLNRLISRRGGSEVQEIELIFKAKIRPGADLSKYKKNGAVNIPNTADVILNDKKKTSKEVTVTPPKPKEPTVSKKINNTLDSLVTFDGQPYTYNITTAVPSDVAGYKKFVISDKLDADLEFDGQASISGPLADVFEIQTNGQTVTATVKEGKFAELAKYSFVELTIPAKVKAGVTGKTIENKAKISFTNENDVAKEVESNPVTVTPPPVTKKINENLDHLDIATGQPYKYNVKTTLPSDITSYKEFVITDTLEDELSVINEGTDKPVISGPAAEFFDVTVSGQKVTATMKNFAGASALAGQEIELVIPAKINDGVTRSNIPNKATFSFKDKNDHKGEKETIPVTVTPPTEPNVSKKINGDQDNATIAAETDFTYNIKTTLPNDIDTYKSFVITDTLDENLGVVNPEPSISEEAKKFFDITVSGNTVTATMKDFAKASALANKEIELVIHAKVKKESVLPEIPNTAKITYTNKNNESKEKETEPVKVTPPPITKKVNGKDQEELASLTSSFKYTVDSKVPTVADKFVLSDTLEEVLTFDGDATVTIDGQAVTDVTVAKKDQKLTVTFDKDQVKKYAGKAVQVAFDAKIKSGYTVDQLVAKYPNGDKAAIPNKANFVVNDNPETEKFSNPVTVTPPPPNTPEIEKKVNGADSYNLQTRLEEFTYSLNTAMPTNATEFTVTDELKSVLEFAGNKGDVEVKIDGKAANDQATISTDKNTLTVAFAEKAVKANAGKSIEVTFKAKIREGANLLDYLVPGQGIRIPNKASYDIDHNPKFHKDSNEVPVTPPSPEQPPIEKDVNDKAEATLEARDEEFTYHVKTKIPYEATAFNITDTLKDVLDFSGEKGQAEATVDGKKLSDDHIAINGQTITVTLNQEELKANADKEIKLTFKAKIRPNANLAAYVVGDKVVINNQASYNVDLPDNPGVHKDSNIVPVTPPSPEKPEIEKTVNDAKEATLANRDEIFTYKVKTKVPFDATAFSIDDTIKDVLEFADAGSATLNGEALEADRISIADQKITLTLTEDQVKNNGGKEVVLTFKAKIRQGANLSGYIEKGKTVINNQASYNAAFPNDPNFHKDSNIVPVTPPSPENPPIEKKVNEAESANLGARDEEFTYTIDTTVPLDVTGFAVYDTIEKVLEFSGENGQASATVDGQPLDASHITIKGQKITVKLTEDEAKALGGKAVHVSFKAKIKAGANLSDYIEKDGTTRIYNTAKYNFNNDPGTEQSSKPVPVIPPTPTEPELKKEVNGKEAETLANRDDVFTYTVKTTVPQDATAFSISDKLEDVLEFAGESSATLAGEDLKADQITTDGQTIKLTLTEDQVKANGGKEVVLNFKAKIREGANLSAYMKADKAEVPNKASYTVGFPNKPAVTKDSNVVPVTPPSPEQPPIEKDVNSKPSETIADRTEEFTYNIHTTMPQDATGFTVTDELKDVLEFAGDVQVTLGGKKADAAVAKNGQTLEVTFPEETVKANGGKKVQVTFKAKIKADADLTPYETANSYSVPNTASYLINNNPASKKETKPVTVEVPKQPGPEVTKKINRTLDHLDVDRDVPYMYNVNTQIPKDIRLYKEFTVTDTLEPVLEITGTPVAYVDGYATDAVETKVEGNTVTVTVKDFARISGYKEIQLYIPAKLKADSDLSAYENQTVPNKATIAFKDSNGKNGTKESNPVTVRPRDPEKPEEPKPNEPAKTVGPADGSNPSTAYRLKELKEGFRFDVTAKVPTDPVDESGNPIKDAQGRDVKTELNSFTVTDELEKVLKVDRVAVKVEENKVAEAIAKITAKIEKAESDLKELEGKETNGTFAKKLAEAEKKVEELTAQLAAAKEKATAAATPATPATSSDSDAGNATATPAPADNNAEVVALEESLKAAQAELEQLKADGAKAGNLATPEEQKVEQDKLNKNLEQLKESKEKLEKALEAFTTVNDKGEITDEALAKIAKVTVEGQKVTVEVTDKAVLEALKGSTFRVIIYSSIKDGADLSSYLNKENNETKIPNKATVTFNDKPKVTNTVNVYPPEPNTPPTTPHTPPTTPNTPPPTTPDTPPAPKGDLPPAPTPEPEKPKNILPKTGTSGTMVNEVIIGMILVLMGLLLRRKPKH
ncbi:isopeptide-forming domain-containing fimbrial protein [Streptococcus gordonii]|uniref:isopeptide-forming domain-containing fimbrial protein n=1 Tax=Streptococcus gordonii TaxID=1302 RepID=UPI001C63DEEA|nr:isopeptide-forming domain-containing fimbrial protein [Streptococcus gordonii]MBW7664142.1 isopeptide-forming domain-containing fimbrial protein [Streptococcus gordonii]